MAVQVIYRVAVVLISTISEVTLYVCVDNRMFCVYLCLAISLSFATHCAGTRILTKPERYLNDFNNAFSRAPKREASIVEPFNSLLVEDSYDYYAIHDPSAVTVSRSHCRCDITLRSGVF